jgi:hypothetical protein
MQMGADAKKVKAAAGLIEEAKVAARELHEFVSLSKALAAFEGISIIGCTTEAAVANRSALHFLAFLSTFRLLQYALCQRPHAVHSVSFRRKGIASLRVVSWLRASC